MTTLFIFGYDVSYYLDGRFVAHPGGPGFVTGTARSVTRTTIAQDDNPGNDWGSSGEMISHLAEPGHLPFRRTTVCRAMQWLLLTMRDRTDMESLQP